MFIMKRIFTLIALCATLGLAAQHKVAQRVAELKSVQSNFRHFSVLDPVSEIQDTNISKILTKATMATIRNAEVNDIVSNRYETIELDIPYQGQTITVELYKANLFHDGFHLDTDKAVNIPYEQGVYYRGIVKGDNNSIVAMNFFNNELNGIISNETVYNLVIGKLDKANNTSDYIVYSDADLTIQNNAECSLKDDAGYQVKVPEQGGPSNKIALSTKCVTMYFEMDYTLYTQNGSNTTTTNNWMTSVFNNVQTLYDNDGITVSLKNVYIWTTADSYSGTTSTVHLSQFHQTRPVFDGDVGQLISMDPGGLGGVAAGVNGLCASSNYSYADVDFGYNSVPTYSWTVEVVTHEMGHLLGSPHTHSCVWNGNNTPIDNCGPSAIAGSEGTICMTSPPTLPSATVKGTIMSYCHLVAGIGINLSNGFGTQPATRILNAIDASTCLSTDCTNTCINTAANIRATSTNPTSVTIEWDDVGDVASWQVSVSTLTGSGSWTTVTSTSFTATNLTANTYYKIKVKPVCDSGMSVAFRQAIFATSAAWCNGTTITDTGGSTGSYGNDQDFVRVIIPVENDKKITMNFTSFHLENNYDFLYIFDGSTTSAPDLSNGGFTGATNPGTFTSSAADGALTLRFSSDDSTTDSGFVAAIDCLEKLGTGDFTQNIDFTYYPNPANDVVNIHAGAQMTSLEVYNVAGQLLVNQKLSTMDTKVDISAFSTGTYFFNLKFDQVEANFKILKF
jgi:hypothetical protein